MSCKEAEALGGLFEEHLSEIAVSKTYLTVISNRSGNTETLKTFADCGCSLGCLAAVLLDCDCRAYCICPLCILEADTLYVLNHVIYVKSGILCDLLSFLYVLDAILIKSCVDLVNTRLIIFK
jgi:hypothetical protein